MTTISYRLLRTHAARALGLPEDPGGAELRNELMDEAAVLFALHRPASLNFALIAKVLSTRPSVLVHCFADMDGLLGAILLRHLQRLKTALQDASPAQAQGETLEQSCRRAYLAATRTPNGVLTRDHRLLLTHATHLAFDQVKEIEAHLQDLAKRLGGLKALALCDCPHLDAAEIERTLGANPPVRQPQAQAPAQTAKPAPAQTPAAMPQKQIAAIPPPRAAGAPQPPPKAAPPPIHIPNVRTAEALGRTPIASKTALPCSKTFLPAFAAQASPAAPVLRPR